MPVPIPPGTRTLFDPAFVRIYDQPSLVSVVETATDGAATVNFQVNAPCVTLRPRKGGSLHWLKNQQCADAAILIWCGNESHVHLVELKKKITAKSWGTARTQFAGMLANVLSLLGNARLPPPTTVTCHVAFADDNLAASPVLAKVLNTVHGQQPLAGVQWAADSIDLPDQPGASLRKIMWGDAACAIDCP